MPPKPLPTLPSTPPRPGAILPGQDAPEARLRRFNRSITAEIGLLNDSWLGLGRPLALARLLQAIGPEGAELAALRQDLGFDSGFLSRGLRALEAEGLIETLTDPEDGRRRLARPRPAGLAEIARYEALSQDHARALLARLPQGADGGAGLLDRLEEITLAFSRARITLTPCPADSPAALAAVSAYLDELSQIFGRPITAPPPGPRDLAALSPPAGIFLLAQHDGLTLGCVSLRPENADPSDRRIGEVKRLWVAPGARGLGLAQRLMARLETEAQALGYHRLRLDTNERLDAARALYASLGWRAIARYNDNADATHFFEKALSPPTGALR